MRRRLLPLLASVLAVTCAPTHSAPIKAIAVPQTTAKITIDGLLDEPAWQKAGRIPAFEHYQGLTELKNQTEVLLLYDIQALYVAYRCSEADMPGIKATVTQHDASVWHDDCVEIFLDTKGDRSGFVQLILNTLGTKYDGLGSDPYGYNPKWEGKAHSHQQGWTAEIRIPFSELGMPVPKPGNSWLGNFCREEQPAEELSCWLVTMGNFAAPGRFGEVVFGTLADKARLDIKRLLKEIADLERSTAPANKPRLLAESRAMAQAAHSILDETPGLTESSYFEIQSLLNIGQRAITRLKGMVHRAGIGDPDFLLWETTPWRHFTPAEDSTRVVQDTTCIETVVLLGQTESKALMLTNLTDETLIARLGLEGFDELPGQSVEILVPTFVRSADDRLFPDALIPPDAIGQLVVPPCETRQIWISIRGTKPGKFEGRLTVSPLTASKADKVVQFAVEVVRPPVKPAEPLAFTWDFLGDAAKLGLEAEYVRSMAEHGITVFMVSGLHHMPRPHADDAGELLDPMDWSKFQREVSLKWSPGRKLYINMDVWEKDYERKIYNGKFDSPGWRVAFKKVVTEMVVVLRRLGLSYDDYMVCPVDESIDERYLAIARLVKQADPKIRIVADTIGTNLEQVKEADPYTDWWIPHFKAYFARDSSAQIEYLKCTGKPIGFYFYSEGANEKAQDSYHHYLWKFWYAYSEDLTGIFGYWTATQHYGNPWNRHQTTAAYDPSLFYYGNGCVVTGRRWEAWRRGIEDFALLRLCESAGVDKDIISQAVKSVLDAPDNPDVADDARKRLTESLLDKR